MVEAVEGARVKASSRCSSSQTQQLLVEDSSRTVRRMTMVDGAVCDLGHAQDRVATAQVAASVALRSGVATTSSFRNIGSDVRVRTAGGAEADRAPA